MSIDFKAIAAESRLQYENAIDATHESLDDDPDRAMVFTQLAAIASNRQTWAIDQYLRDERDEHAREWSMRRDEIAHQRQAEREESLMDRRLAEDNILMQQRLQAEREFREAMAEASKNLDALEAEQS